MPQATTELWSLGGIAMSVEKDSSDIPVVRMGELGPLDSSKTILHYGGTESYGRELTAVMWNYSSYVNTLMPLVGSGYHTLVSDDGAQGDYFIQSCKPERLQDFIQCVGNSPVRISMQLKKANIAVEQATLAWTATYDHLYYTSDFPTPGGGTQPVWTTVTETGDFDSGDIDAFGVDPLRPDYYKYIFFWPGAIRYIAKLDSSPTGSNEWEETISTTDIRTAGDLFLHASANLHYFKVDPITGYLWAIAYYSTASYTIVGFYKSSDRGETWELSDSYVDNTYRLLGTDSFDVFNDVLVFAYHHTPTSDMPRIIWTLDGGDTWSNHHLNNANWGRWIYHLYLHPASYSTKCYYIEDVDVDGHTNICSFTFSTTTRIELLDMDVESGGYNILPRAHPAWWGNYNDEDSMILLFTDRNDDSGYTWVTDDNWSTYTEYEPLIENINGTVEQVFYTDPSLYEEVVYGGYDFPIGTPDHILGGVTSLSDETVAGVCGDNSDSSPYTNSIPNDEIITWVGGVYFHYSNLLGTNLWSGLY